MVTAAEGDFSLKTVTVLKEYGPTPRKMNVYRGDLSAKTVVLLKEAYGPTPQKVGVR
jgi:hypothetical protein